MVFLDSQHEAQNAHQRPAVTSSIEESAIIRDKDCAAEGPGKVPSATP